MFVSDLDRPWHQTPFPIQGFHIRALVSHCKWVSIDVAETRDSVALAKTSAPAFGTKGRGRGEGREELHLPPLSIREPVKHQSITTLKREMKTSKYLLEDAGVALERLYEAVTSQEARDLRPIAAVINKMVRSVIRQPDALLWLSRIRRLSQSNASGWRITLRTILLMTAAIGRRSRAS